MLSSTSRLFPMLGAALPPHQRTLIFLDVTVPAPIGSAQSFLPAGTGAPPAQPCAAPGSVGPAALDALPAGPSTSLDPAGPAALEALPAGPSSVPVIVSSPAQARRPGSSTWIPAPGWVSFTERARPSTRLRAPGLTGGANGTGARSSSGLPRRAFSSTSTHAGVAQLLSCSLQAVLRRLPVACRRLLPMLLYRRCPRIQHRCRRALSQFLLSPTSTP